MSKTIAHFASAILTAHLLMITDHRSKDIVVWKQSQDDAMMLAIASRPCALKRYMPDHMTIRSRDCGKVRE